MVKKVCSPGGRCDVDLMLHFVSKNRVVMEA